jgi:hypothetical protein
LDQAEYDAIVTNVELRKAHAKTNAAYAKKTKEETTLTYDVILPSNFKLSQRVLPGGATGADDKMVNANCTLLVYFKATGATDTRGQPIMGLHSKFVDMNSAKEMRLPTANPGQALFDLAFRGL